MDHLPGVTVNRYCSSSLQTTRMAFHAIKAGEGDVFISAGVETVSRYLNGWSRQSRGQNPVFADAQARHRQALAGGGGHWVDPRTGRAARPLHRDGADRGERRAAAGHVARRAGRVRRAQPEPRVPADRGGLLGARHHPRHAARRHACARRRRPAPRHDARGGLPLEAGVPPDGTVTAGNAARSTTARPRSSSCATRAARSSG